MLKASPLDSFVATSSGSNDVKIPPLPKLQNIIMDSGFAAGISQFDEQMEEWRQNLERTLNQQLAGKQPADISKSNT